MLDIFRDPVWQFIGALVAVIAIAISIVQFLAQRKRKKLSYEILSKTPILSAAEEISGKIQISYQGELVKNVYLVVVKLCNSGNLPITTGDYESPINVKFVNSERLLSAEVSETSPSNLPITIQTIEKSIRLNPILLNPGDTIVIKTLISEYDNEIEVDGRIVGVQNIEKRVEAFGWSFALLVVGLFLMISAILRLLAHQSINDPIVDPIDAILFVFAYSLSFMGFLGSRLFKTFRKVIRSSRHTL